MTPTRRKFGKMAIATIGALSITIVPGERFVVACDKRHDPGTRLFMTYDSSWSEKGPAVIVGDASFEDWETQVMRTHKLIDRPLPGYDYFHWAVSEEVAA